MNTKQFHGLAHVQRKVPKKGVYLEFLSWKEVESILQGTKAVLLPKYERAWTSSSYEQRLAAC